MKFLNALPQYGAGCRAHVQWIATGWKSSHGAGGGNKGMKHATASVGLLKDSLSKLRTTGAVRALTARHFARGATGNQVKVNRDGVASPQMATALFARGIQATQLLHIAVHGQRRAARRTACGDTD